MRKYGWPAVSGRTQAYYAALHEAGIASDPSLVATVDWGGLQGAEAMGELLGLREPPTAVYAHSDEVALGAVRTLRRAGYGYRRISRSSASTITRSPS